MNTQNLLGNLSFLSLFGAMIFYWIGLSFDGFSFNKADKTKVTNSGGSIALLSSSLELPGDWLYDPKNLNANDTSLKTDGPFGPNSQKAPSAAVGINSHTNTFVKKGNQNIFSRLGRYTIILSNVLLALLLTFRWKESGHFPLSNLYESLMFLSWSFTGLHLFFFSNGTNLTSPPKADGPKGPNSAAETNLSENSDINAFFNGKFTGADKLLGAITTPSALFTNAFATFTLPKEMQEAAPLVPALQSNWLMMHVTVMILSYAALILGSLLSIGYLIVTFNSENDFLSLQNSSPVSKFNEVKLTNNTEQNSLSSQNTLKAKLEKKMKLGSILDNLSYRILGIGFPFLTIGILSGAVWANEAWGSYWSWDPKETWALLTWLIFAIYLHIRLNKGWEGKKPAIIAALGFVIVWICYLGVNLIGEGLHSYGWLATSG